MTKDNTAASASTTPLPTLITEEILLDNLVTDKALLSQLCTFGARWPRRGVVMEGSLADDDMVSQLRAFDELKKRSRRRSRFDGVNLNGEKRFITVSALQDQVNRTLNKVPKATPGSYVGLSL